MKAKDGILALIGVALILVAVGYYAPSLGYRHGGAAFIDIKKYVNKNTTTPALETGSFIATPSNDATVSFQLQLSNTEDHNITAVTLYYAINPADPENANYTAVNMTEQNGTWKYVLKASFGDAIYYYAVVNYDKNATLRIPSANYSSVLVQDKIAPEISNLTLAYNATGNYTVIRMRITDNDAIKSAILYYAVSNSSFKAKNLTVENITWSNITISEGSNTSVDVYGEIHGIKPGSYLAFYIAAQDLSGNVAKLPASGYYEVELTSNTTAWTPDQEEGGTSG